MTDPRASALSDPRIPVPDTRAALTICTCGLPNCPRVPHHPAPQGPGFSPDGHYVTPHGMTVPLGGAPMGHVDPAVFYSMGPAAYNLKESPDVLRSLPQINGYYPYDPTSVYPYMNGYAGIDARRKNATKESTNTLKAWLFEHRKNPYPTKGEKIMLAILTKMTLTQVSTWFANARRRLKKENKMTWSSKDDDLDGDDDVTSEHNSDITERANVSGSNGDCDDVRLHHGSIGDDDDVLSVTSGGDRSEIDVEEHSDDINDDLRRIPQMMPHALNPNAANAVFLGSHGQSIYSPLLTSMSKSMTSSDNRDVDPMRRESLPGGELPSQRDPSFANRLVSPMSPCHSKPNHVVPITPPPSPKDAKSSTSPLSSHSSHSRSHHSSATIHHHPKSSPSSGPVTSGSASAPSSSSSSSPSKPKIWSIADVVSKKDSSTPPCQNSASSAAKPSHSSETSPIITIGGAPSRIDRIHGSMSHPHLVPGAVVPGPEGAFGMAYYPYGLHHSAAAAAFMASQASHLASRVPHPYSRLGAGLHGHPVVHHPHPALSRSVGQSRSDYTSPTGILSTSPPQTSLVSSAHRSPGSSESKMSVENGSRKQESMLRHSSLSRS